MASSYEVPQYAELGLYGITSMLSLPQIQDFAVRSPLNEKLLDLFKSGNADEFYVLGYFLRLCTHRQAKGLPIEKMEQLFMPLMLGKARTSTTMMAILILAALVDSDKTRAFSYGEAATTTMKYMCTLVKTSLSRDTRNRDDRWGLDVILAGIANLTVNAENQKLFGEAGLIPLLVEVLRTNKTDPWLMVLNRDTLNESKKHALTALMNLAFHPANVAFFSEKAEGASASPKTEIHSLLEVAKKQGEVETGKEDAVLKERIKALESVLFILDTPNAANKKVEPASSSASSSSSQHIMISYQWGVQPTVLKLAQRLKTLGHKVWLDVEQMQGSTLDAMANAVEQASVVLICVSQKYKDSPNCRLEGEYAQSCLKKTVFLKTQDYHPDGWLGIMLGAKLWYNFYEDDKFDESVAAVHLVLAGQALPGVPPSGPSSLPLPPPQPATSHSVPPVVANHHCLAWTKDDVRSWLTRINLPEYGDLFEKQRVTGVALLQLARFLSQDPALFISLCEKYGIQTLGDILVLAHALGELLHHK